MADSRQPRSPNYPVLGLGTAVENLERFYKQEGKHSVSREAAVSAWGYASLNGRSLRILSACIQYGLLEGGSGKVKVSDLGFRILMPKTEQEKLAALREALRSPKAFAEILDEYPGQPPSDKELRIRLVKDGGYHDVAAAKFIKALRASLELVGNAGGAPESNEGMEPSGPSGDIPMNMLRDNGLFNSTAISPTNSPGQWSSTSQFDLSGGTRVQISLRREKSDSPPNGDELEEFEAYLQIFLKGLRRKTSSRGE